MLNLTLQGALAIAFFTALVWVEGFVQGFERGAQLGLIYLCTTALMEIAQSLDKLAAQNSKP